MRLSSKVKLLQILFGASFLGVLGYNFYVANDLKYKAEGDAADFISLGTSLAKVQKYGHLEIPGDVVDAFKNKTVDRNYGFKGHSTWRPPIWPLLIASIFLLYGFNLTYLLIFKFLLHFLGTYIFFRTLKTLKLNEILIVLGTFSYGVSPSWQLYSRVFLSEPITLFFITLWIYLLIRFLKTRKNYWLQALVAGIAVLCHPYYIFLPFSVWLILFLGKKINFKIFFLSAFLSAAVISTWILRNFIVLDTTEIVLTTSSGAVMAKGWNKHVPEKHTNTKGDLADETLVLESYEHEERRRNEVERMQLYKDATFDFVRSNPDIILPVIGRKLKSAFNPFPETPRPGVLETGRWLFQFLAFLSLIYLLFFSRHEFISSLAIGLILSTIAITILTYSGFRFRMPQSGLELLFIVYAFSEVIRDKKWSRSKNKP